MDSILQLISRNDGKKLDEILRGQKTKKTLNNLDLKTEDFEEFLVFASYAGSASCLLVLSKFGKFTNF